MVAKKLQSEQTKGLLLHAGFQVMKEKGIKSLTAAQISTAAGVSKSGFFHHFPTIDDYYLYMLEQMMQMIETQIFEEKPATMKEFLEVSMETTLNLTDEMPEFMTIIYFFIDFSRFNPIYLTRLQGYIKASLEKWVEDMSQYFPPDYPQAKKETFVAILDIFFSGIGTQYLILQDRDLCQKISKEFISMILNYFEGSTK
ncbi:MAG: TetR/AcrR family transcriptional regulator [SAR324 cluster bacterium]|nr:TetR/AcrR family transcriptional regulator [SAR324 cluster bacterium]